MRAAAVALVLIVGAAVVLWFGNTLNSLVLGGLIGGLAALLLSIPISLALFTYLSRKHDDQLRAEVQEEMTLAQTQTYEYREAPEHVFVEEEYQLPAEFADNYQLPQNLPAQSYARLPAQRQNQLVPFEGPVQRPRSTEVPLAPERSLKQLPVGRNANANSLPTPARRPLPGRQSGRYPGFPGYQSGSIRGLHQTSALRAARQEAAQQRQDDMEMYPTGPSKRLPVARPVQSLVSQAERNRSLRTSQHLASQQASDQYRPKRTVDGSSGPPSANRSLPGAGDSSAHRYSQEMQLRQREQNTDQLAQPRYRQADHIRQQPTTGHMTRNPQVEAQRRNPDVISGSLKNPLVRRAPYMYEDDPLREELAQQIDLLPKRRSSRYEEEEY